MSASAGWYPDPGGGQNLYRYWDGKAWSAATSPNPSAPPPTQGLVGPAGIPGDGGGAGGSMPTTSGGSTVGYGHNPYGSGQATPPQANPYGAGFSPLGSGRNSGQQDPYSQYQATQKKRSPVGWWVAGAALLVVIIVVVVVAVRAVSGSVGTTGNPPNGQASGSVCPAEPSRAPTPQSHPNDGRVHGGPVSFPTLGPPFQSQQGDNRVPFGTDVAVQQVTVESNYDQRGDSWVASVLVGELQAGDGFFTPEQGAQIVVKCILGKFYGNNPVTSDVKVNNSATIDGHSAWLVESQLSFDIPGLRTKGERLIVAIVASGQTAGLFYASIPDTTPELLAPAREALKQLQVDG